MCIRDSANTRDNESGRHGLPRTRRPHREAHTQSIVFSQICHIRKPGLIEAGLLADPNWVSYGRLQNPVEEIPYDENTDSNDTDECCKQPWLENACLLYTSPSPR